MRLYELTLVVSPDITSEKQKSLITKIKKIITGLEGKVVKEEDWGKKELSYPIKKQTTGCFFYWEIELPEKTVADFDNKIKTEEEIIRYLLVRKEVKHGAKVAK